MTKPSDALLCKLASVVVHADEMLGPDAHAFDLTALQQLLLDPDVRGWIVGMKAFAPTPRGRLFSSSR